MIDNLTQSRIDRLERRIAVAQRDLRELRKTAGLRLPAEPRNNGEPILISFQKRFGKANDTVYSYAAGRAPGMPERRSWSITGQGSMTSVSWNTVVEFIKSDEGPIAQLALDSIMLWRPSTFLRDTQSNAHVNLSPFLDRRDVNEPPF